MSGNSQSELYRLDAAIRHLMQTMKRPQWWTYITKRANVDIDRPAAMILFILSAPHTESIKLHDIAERLGIEAPSVTRKCQQLEKNNLVLRIQDTQDKRTCSLQITNDGQIITEKLHIAHHHILNDVLKSWPIADKQNFINLLERFNNDLTTHSS